MGWYGAILIVKGNNIIDSNIMRSISNNIFVTTTNDFEDHKMVAYLDLLSESGITRYVASGMIVKIEPVSDLVTSC
jgi:hypothetical protein